MIEIALVIPIGRCRCPPDPFQITPAIKAGTTRAVPAGIAVVQLRLQIVVKNIVRSVRRKGKRIDAILSDFDVECAKAPTRGDKL
jgi:hypothetical protein